MVTNAILTKEMIAEHLGLSALKPTVEDLVDHIEIGARQAAESMRIPKEMIGGEINLVGGPARGTFDAEPMSSQDMVIASTKIVPDNKIVISDDGRMMVSIDVKTGQIEFGEDYSFDEASHLFWTCMGADSPKLLKAEIAELKKAALKLQDSYCNDDMDAKKEYSEPRRLGVARLVATIRRSITELADPFIFESNDTETRYKLTDAIEKYLSTLKADCFIGDYTVCCDETNNPLEIVDCNQLKADVAIRLCNTIEYIHIPLHIKPTIPKFVTDMDDEILADVIRAAEKNAYDEDYVNANSYDDAMKVI